MLENQTKSIFKVCFFAVHCINVFKDQKRTTFYIIKFLWIMYGFANKVLWQ